MKLFIVFIPVIYCCHLTGSPAAGECRVPDTSKVIQKQLNAGFAMAAFREGEMNAPENRSVSLSSEIGFSRLVIHHRAKQLLRLKSELNYTYIRDSLWNKNLDRLSIEYQVTPAGKSPAPTAGLSFHTGLLNDREYYYNASTGYTNYRVTGTILNPATMEISAGMVFQRKEWLTINFDLSSARFRSFHHTQLTDQTELLPIAKYHSGLLVFDIGINLQYRFLKTFRNGFEFSGNGRFFIKNLKEERIDGEIHTRLDYKITKRVRLKSDLRLRYDPTLAPGLWMQSEIQTGFYYESGP